MTQIADGRTIVLVLPIGDAGQRSNYTAYATSPTHYRNTKFVSRSISKPVRTDGLRVLAEPSLMLSQTANHNKNGGTYDVVEEKKREATTAITKLEEYMEAKQAETTAAVAEWKANRDLKKLEKRADRAEKNAEVCVELALYYAGEAQVAILEAAAARIDADAAA